MLLSELTESLVSARQSDAGDPEIRSIQYDSRRVVPGALFACIRGDNFDGHKFALDAVKKGAAAVLADDPAKLGALSVPTVVVPDTRLALPIIANRFFGFPSRKLKLVGVTGTKGKTTTTYLVEAVLRQAGMETGVIGTIGTVMRGRPVHSERTTPEAVDLQGLLADMVSEGVDAVSMEVSSHALVKHRTEGCEYDAAVFTNLTHDHLDFHGTLDEYLQAKLILFRDYPKASSKAFTAVINADDPRAPEVAAAAVGRVLTYGVRSDADIRAGEIAATMTGLSFDVFHPGGTFHVELGLGGKFNASNSLAAVGCGLALGIEPEAIKAGLESVRAVPGRFESVDCGQDYAVVVDYAHSPDSLENVLKSARELTSGRLIVVFGCGGNRDAAKRPIMGRMAAERGDVCIVTSDNPRHEDPEDIIRQILVGIPEDRRRIVEAVTDRRSAIRLALEGAGPGDFVLIAGKGHEDYQEVRGVKSHFDDREVVREILSEAK